MVKDLSDSERGNPLPPHGPLFQFNSKGSFIYMHYSTDRITHTMVFITNVVEQLLNRFTMKDRSDDPSYSQRRYKPYFWSSSQTRDTL